MSKAFYAIVKIKELYGEYETGSVHLITRPRKLTDLEIERELLSEFRNKGEAPADFKNGKTGGWWNYCCGDNAARIVRITPIPKAAYAVMKKYL
jgi:hypothetical protein